MKTETPDQNSKLKILYEDEYLIIANKPVGLPVQPDKTEDESLFDLVKKHSKKEPHLLTRLDRVVSGATLFALDKEVAKELSFFMINKEIKKEYLAVTATAPEEKKGEFLQWISFDSNRNKSYTYPEKRTSAKRARLTYEILAESDNYYLWNIDLITGRHHQIRAQLASYGHPVKGDVKYGARRKNADRSIHLHAWKMELEHPITNEKIHVVAPFPEDNLWKFFQERLEKR
jgi:23S rRNA pseudouridine1911/1915/1917 synthase